MNKILLGLTIFLSCSSVSKGVEAYDEINSMSTTCNVEQMVGQGTEDNPFIICTQNQFNKMADEDNADKYYRLGQSIIVSNHNTISTEFTGNLDGRGFVIDLRGTLNPSTGNSGIKNYGLFESVSSKAVFSNIVLTTSRLDVNLIGTNANFGLLAANVSSKDGYVGTDVLVDKVHVRNRLNVYQSSTNVQAGILFGNINNSNVDVKRTSYVGNVVYSIQDTAAKSNTIFGGLVGNVEVSTKTVKFENTHSDLLISFNNSTGNVADNVFGGLVGSFKLTANTAGLSITNSIVNGKYLVRSLNSTSIAGGFIGTTNVSHNKVTLDKIMVFTNVEFYDEQTAEVGYIIGKTSGSVVPTQTNTYAFDGIKFSASSNDALNIAFTGIKKSVSEIDQVFFVETLGLVDSIWTVSNPLWDHIRFIGIKLADSPVLTEVEDSLPEDNIAKKTNNTLLIVSIVGISVGLLTVLVSLHVAVRRRRKTI